MIVRIKSFIEGLEEKVKEISENIDQKDKITEHCF